MYRKTAIFGDELQYRNEKWPRRPSTVCTHFGHTTEPNFSGDNDLDYGVRKQRIILISCRLGFYRSRIYENLCRKLGRRYNYGISAAN